MRVFFSSVTIKSTEEMCRGMCVCVVEERCFYRASECWGALVYSKEVGRCSEERVK